jgi:alkanesulfonate monooxygenase SsuD/methylene tetrahydromethanopterin reductase-like flavin-dependent oxidoreductase (luciferase family)
VELGIGEGSTPTELHPFDRRFRDKRPVWEDAVRALIPMFTEPVAEYHGPHFDFPPRNVLPKPLQKPHPPLWVACSQLETIQMAGMRGMGALGFQFASADTAATWVHAYYDAYLNHLDKLADYQTNPNIAVVSGFMCCETDEEALRKSAGWTFFQFALRYYGSKGVLPPGEVSLWEEYEKWRATPEGQKQSRTGLIGSPETLRRRLRKFEQSNVDQVILLNQAGKNTHEDICASLELFGREVMPEFQARDPEHQAWKRAVLSRELELARPDTTQHEDTTSLFKPTQPPSSEA